MRIRESAPLCLTAGPGREGPEEVGRGPTPSVGCAGATTRVKSHGLARRAPRRRLRWRGGTTTCRCSRPGRVPDGAGRTSRVAGALSVCFGAENPPPADARWSSPKTDRPRPAAVAGSPRRRARTPAASATRPAANASPSPPPPPRPPAPTPAGPNTRCCTGAGLCWPAQTRPALRPRARSTGTPRAPTGIRGAPSRRADRSPRAGARARWTGRPDRGRRPTTRCRPVSSRSPQPHGITQRRHRVHPRRHVQLQISRSTVRASAKSWPAAIDVTAGTPMAGTGTSRTIVVPSPSWPARFCPTPRRGQPPRRRSRGPVRRRRPSRKRSCGGRYTPPSTATCAPSARSRSTR
jgi:hypothetical protein